MKPRASKWALCTQASPKARSNHTFPDTLGNALIVVRSLVGVGGTRPGRVYRRKKDARARRAGYPSFDAMVRALVTAGTFGRIAP